MCRRHFLRMPSHDWRQVFRKGLFHTDNMQRGKWDVKWEMASREVKNQQPSRRSAAFQLSQREIERQQQG